MRAQGIIVRSEYGLPDGLSRKLSYREGGITQQIILDSLDKLHSFQSSCAAH